MCVSFSGNFAPAIGSIKGVSRASKTELIFLMIFLVLSVESLVSVLSSVVMEIVFLSVSVDMSQRTSSDIFF